MVLIAYTGPGEALYDLSNLRNLILLEPLVKDVIEYHIKGLLSGDVIKFRDGVYHISIDAIEKLIELNPQLGYMRSISSPRGFAIPSFFELANIIHHEDRAVVQEPGLTSAFVFYTRNLLNSLCKLSPRIILIIDTIMDRIIKEDGDLLYGYKDMYIIESYLFLSEACNNILLYVKNLRKAEKIVEKIVNGSDSIGIAVDIEYAAKRGVPANIIEVVKHRTGEFSIGVVVPMQKHLDSDEKKTLQRLLNTCGDRMIIIAANTKPITATPIEKLEKASLHKFINHLEEALSREGH